MKAQLFAVTILFTLALSSGAQATSVNQRVDEIDQKQRILERKLELQEEKNKDGAQVTAGKEGFSIKSNDGKFQLKLRGLIHSDGRLLCQRS